MKKLKSILPRESSLNDTLRGHSANYQRNKFSVSPLLHQKPENWTKNVSLITLEDNKLNSEIASGLH